MPDKDTLIHPDRRLVALLAVIALETLLRLIHPHTGLDVITYTFMARILELICILAIAFPVCGLKSAHPAKELGIGAGAAAAFGALVVVTDLTSRLWLPGGLLPRLIGVQHPAQPILFFVTACVAAPFVEELFFRGLFYSLLRERTGMIFAVLFSALFFASMHGQIMPVQLVGGLLFAGLYEWRKSIWAPWTLHAAANFGIWIFPFIYPWWS